MVLIQPVPLCLLSASSVVWYALRLAGGCCDISQGSARRLHHPFLSPVLSFLSAGTGALLGKSAVAVMVRLTSALFFVQYCEPNSLEARLFLICILIFSQPLPPLLPSIPCTDQVQQHRYMCHPVFPCHSF